jgi:hypothetical protein
MLLTKKNYSHESVLSANSMTFMSFGAFMLLQVFFPCYIGNELKVNSQLFLTSIEYGECKNASDKKNFVNFQNKNQERNNFSIKYIFDDNQSSLLFVHISKTLKN